MTNKELYDEITKLSDEYYSLISTDHHKDRDCHFAIATEWNYGRPQIYRVEHFGYLAEEISHECPSYTEALQYLKNKLTDMVQNIKECDEQSSQDY